MWIKSNKCLFISFKYLPALQTMLVLGDAGWKFYGNSLKHLDNYWVNLKWFQNSF